MKTRIDNFNYEGKQYHVIRDDLIGPHLNGNKARKFFWLCKQPENFTQNIVSWGGSQSNAMYALSHICKNKRWQFSYYVKTVPAWLKQNPAGNFRFALENGMKLHEIPPVQYKEKIQQLKNIEKLAVRYKNRALDSDGEVLAGELKELGIDSEKADPMTV